MRRYAILSLLALSACSIIVRTLPEDCESTSISCEGNLLTSCEDGLVVRVDCGELACNATLGECSTCGNGVEDAGEECDDGNDVSGDGCQANCALPDCGDGVVDNGEECDDGGANSDSQPNACRSNCLNAACGDNVIDTGEECDDGDANSDTAANACRTSCLEAACGDGVVDFADLDGDGQFTPNAGEGEQCDDGNDIDDDGCEFSPNADTGETCLATFPTCDNGIAREANANGDQEICYEDPQLNLPSGDAPLAITAARLNGDGLDDIAVVNQNNESLTLYINESVGGSGDIGVSATHRRNIPIPNIVDPVAIAAGDLNGDNKIDLVTANQGGNITAMINSTTGALNTPDITFSSFTNFTAGDSPSSLALLDINKDGLLDAVVTNQNFDQLSFLTGNGDGTFDAVRTQDITGCQKPVSVAAADIIGNDGNIDVAVACEDSDNVVILRGDGQAVPSFNAATGATISLPANAAPRSVAVGDIDVDGDIDLAVANTGLNTVSILLNSAGNFANSVGSPFEVGRGPRSVIIEDINHDPSALDVIAVNQTDSTVSVLRGKASAPGAFAPQFVINVGQNPTAAAIGDFEPNAYTDIVTTNLAQDNISILYFTP